MSADALPEALAALAALPRILVGVDFDGTLAPFDPDPAAARPGVGGLEVLRDLAELQGVYVAVVSGRDLDSLGQVTGFGGQDVITLIGSHGAQTTSGSADLEAEPARLLRQLSDELDEVRRVHPGSRLERKRAAVALHTRGLPAQVSEPALRDARAVANRHEGVHVIPGKNVVELAVLTSDKGTALGDLARQLHADGVCYIGDDTTDEAAFASLTEDQHVTIKVGPGDTAARFRVDAVPDVIGALQNLLQLRSSRSSA